MFHGKPPRKQTPAQVAAHARKEAQREWLERFQRAYGEHHPGADPFPVTMDRRGRYPVGQDAQAIARIVDAPQELLTATWQRMSRDPFWTRQGFRLPDVARQMDRQRVAQAVRS